MEYPVLSAFVNGLLQVELALRANKMQAAESISAERAVQLGGALLVIEMEEQYIALRDSILFAPGKGVEVTDPRAKLYDQFVRDEAQFGSFRSKIEQMTGTQSLLRDVDFLRSRGFPK